MIEINPFWIVLLLFIVHTILQHLLNWGLRTSESSEENALMVLATIAEFALLIICLANLFY